MIAVSFNLVLYQLNRDDDNKMGRPACNRWAALLGMSLCR